MKVISKMLVMLALLALFLTIARISQAEDNNTTILFHLKTSLAHDDAQLCVAYNAIWAALSEGYSVNVLIDADTVNTYKTGWRGKDKIEAYRLPEVLRKELSGQFGVSLETVPSTYGEYLEFLHKSGAAFYINNTMLAVAGIENISAGFFKPVELKDMIHLITGAEIYMVY